MKLIISREITLYFEHFEGISMGMLSDGHDDGRYSAATEILEVVEKELKKNEKKPAVRAALFEVKEKCLKIQQEE